MKETGKIACEFVSTSIDPNHKLRLVEEDLDVEKEMFQRIMRKLINLSPTSLDTAYGYCIELVHAQVERSAPASCL